MAIPNVDSLYECGSVLSSATKADLPKVTQKSKLVIAN